MHPDTENFLLSPLCKAFIDKFPLPLAISVNGIIQAANAPYAVLTGRSSPAALKGAHCSAFIHADDRKRFLALNRGNHTGIVSGNTYRWKYDIDGRIVHVEGSPSVFKIGDDTVLISSVIDITEAIEAKRKLAKKHAILAEQNKRLWENLAAGAGICLAQSSQMRKLMEKIDIIAASDVCVVILGETGTGKTMLARVIHDLSARRSRPFVIVNCAAIPEQLLESEFFGVARGAYTGANESRRGYLAAANGGTLFLDEVGELSLAMQAKLLHAIESKRFARLGDTKEEKADIRLICATNRDLEELLMAGKLREDFYYRIFVGDISIPPLRERREDIPPLVKFLLHKLGADDKADQLPRSSLGRLQEYAWPGNVRELQNVLMRYIVTGELAIPDASCQMPKPGQDSEDLAYNLDACLEKAERECLQRALAAVNGRKDKAASLAGMSLRTFHRRCAKYGL